MGLVCRLCSIDFLMYEGGKLRHSAHLFLTKSVCSQRRQWPNFQPHNSKTDGSIKKSVDYKESFVAEYLTRHQKGLKRDNEFLEGSFLDLYLLIFSNFVLFLIYESLLRIMKIYFSSNFLCFSL
jgi:hypothetical protein